MDEFFYMHVAFLKIRQKYIQMFTLYPKAEEIRLNSMYVKWDILYEKVHIYNMDILNIYYSCILYIYQ